jgi:MerR family Zn(II)-responsive transcriptional regulator of zntA
MYTIGRLARRAEISADSIRFYERQGLLSPATKTDAGYRLYTDDAVRRVDFIKRARQCGFSLAEIRELLHMHNGDPSAKRNGYQLAARKQAEIQETFEALTAMTEALSCLLQSSNKEPAGTALEGNESPLLAAFEAQKPQRVVMNDRTARTPEHGLHSYVVA